MKIFNLIKRLIKNPGYISKTRYLSYIDNLDIDEYSILLECQHGTNVNGNIFYLLKELCENEKYVKYRVYISVKKQYKYQLLMFLKGYNLKKFELIEMNTKKYYQTIASVKYLINDNTFLPFFIKRDEQIYLNTWHGTPLKTLGKKINNEFHSIGNTMKNFIVSDYLLYPNVYTRKHMIEDYMLENLARNKIIMNGYPRNSIFFDENAILSIKNKFEMNNKKIIAYMPTWRGTVANKQVENQIEIILAYLNEIEYLLDENSRMYVKLHPIIHSTIDFSNFKKIKSFPNEIETYEFLNACDVLVTDYSSVLFDFVITKKKIILFTYDVDEYLEDRGLYISLKDLPFPQVSNVEALIHEINSPIDKLSDSFIKEYCNYDNKDASKQLLDLLLFNESNRDVFDMRNNGKENVLIYGGNLAKNGITTSLLNLFHHLDTDKRNYYLTFTTAKVAPFKAVLKTLPKGINYIPITGNMNASIFEKLWIGFMRKYWGKYDFNNKKLDRLYNYEIKRSYGNIQFDHVIQFSGYEMKRQLMFGRFESKRSIFVHSNMIEEVNVRKNQCANTLRYAYNHYDHVAIVTEDMRQPTMEYCYDESKIIVVNNVIDDEKVICKSKEDLLFDQNSESNRTLDEIKDIFRKNNKRYITIGRFSVEKGHIRLMDAFNRIYKTNKDTYLFIIGGHGPLLSKTIEHAHSSEAKDHIIIIKSLSNPYSFLKQCHYFVFTSFHEGFGLGLVEADILGIPVMSTNILGPSGFLKEHHGLLVENNEEGIYEGMKLLLTDTVKPMNVDYQKYNERALLQFESLLKR